EQRDDRRRDVHARREHRRLRPLGNPVRGHQHAAYGVHSSVHAHHGRCRSRWWWRRHDDARAGYDRADGDGFRRNDSASSAPSSEELAGTRGSSPGNGVHRTPRESQHSGSRGLFLLWPVCRVEQTGSRAAISFFPLQDQSVSVPLTTNESIRRLQVPTYLIVAFLGVGSAIEVLLAGGPMRIHDVNWRLGVLNSAAGATGTELLALLILVAMGQLALSRGALWAGFYFSVLAA